MRVVETFGPTVQGEGPYAGMVCHFLRLGGCDYRCSWCDTPYAVDPELVRQADDLGVWEVVSRLDALPEAPMLVISGGNPALWRLEELAGAVRNRYEVLAVETQGSVYRAWLDRADSLVVSPKPPSSGEATPRNWRRFESFMAKTAHHPGRVLKVVVFDDTDLAWARGVAESYPATPLYLSAGTDPPGDGDFADALFGVSGRYRWLCEAVAAEPRLHGARVLPQLHVIAWGHAVGV